MKRLIFFAFHFSLLLCLALPAAARRKKTEAPQAVRTQLAPPEARRLSYLYQEGIKKKLTGRLSEAYNLFQHCLAIDPDDPDVLYELGYLQFYLSRDSLGTEMFRRVVELDGSNPRYVQSLAAAYLSQNEYDKAIPVIEHLSKLQTRRSDVLYQLVELYKLNGETDQALRALDRIEVLEGRSLQTAMQKYALYMDKGEKETAFDVLWELEQESPYDLRIPILRGRQYLDNDEPELALACFEKVQRSDPQNPELRMAMMDYYTQSGQPEKRIALRDSLLYGPHTPDELRTQMAAVLIDDLREAPDHRERIMAALDTLVRLSPSVMMYSLRTSYLMRAQVGADTIAASLRDLLTVSPSNENALSRLLVYYLEQRDMEQVAEICRMAVNTHPESLTYYFYLGVALSQMKLTEQAVEVLESSLKQVTEESPPGQISDIYEVLGELYYEQGKAEKAFEAYDSCLVYKDDNAACLNNYAYYLSLRNERLDDAERMAYRATKLEPLNKTYLDTYAWVLFMQGNYMMAKFYIDRVVAASQPDSLLLSDESLHADVLEHAGDIYAQSGDEETALRYWSLALQKGDANAILEKKVKLKKYVKE